MGYRNKNNNYNIKEKPSQEKDKGEGLLYDRTELQRRDLLRAYRLWQKEKEKEKFKKILQICCTGDTWLVVDKILHLAQAEPPNGERRFRSRIMQEKKDQYFTFRWKYLGDGGGPPATVVPSMTPFDSH